MKILFVLFLLLSVGLGAILVLTMVSCTTEYDVGPDRNLTKVTTWTETRDGVTTTRVERKPVGWTEAWNGDLKPFAWVAPEVNPRDRLFYTETTGLAVPLLGELKHWKLVVLRGETPPMVYRRDAIACWARILSASMGPMMVWIVIYVIVSACRSRRPRPRGLSSEGLRTGG